MQNNMQIYLNCSEMLVVMQVFFQAGRVIGSLGRAGYLTSKEASSVSATLGPTKTVTVPGSSTGSSC